MVLWLGPLMVLLTVVVITVSLWDAASGLGFGLVFFGSLAIPIGILSRIDILWDSNAIGDVARRSGMKEIYYADIETERVLTVWRIDTVHLYGE